MSYFWRTSSAFGRVTPTRRRSSTDYRTRATCWRVRCALVACKPVPAAAWKGSTFWGLNQAAAEVNAVAEVQVVRPAARWLNCLACAAVKHVHADCA